MIADRRGRGVRRMGRQWAGGGGEEYLSNVGRMTPIGGVYAHDHCKTLSLCFVVWLRRDARYGCDRACVGLWQLAGRSRLAASDACVVVRSRVCRPSNGDGAPVQPQRTHRGAPVFGTGYLGAGDGAIKRPFRGCTDHRPRPLQVPAWHRSLVRGGAQTGHGEPRGGAGADRVGVGARTRAQGGCGW